MEVQFYVYGVPKGFDLYGDKPVDIAYFQSYYDGSTEYSKLTIHRRNNGQVIYSYLRYNLIDCDGRLGSFFGISAIFHGIYCTDVITFYELFEKLYFEFILPRGILLKSVNGKIVFGVPALQDAEKEIEDILGILRENLKRAFANDFNKLDTSFKLNINEDKVYFLNPDKGNKIISQVSMEYPLLSVSHEYQGSDDVAKRISSQDFDELTSVSEKVQDETNQLQQIWQDINTQLIVHNALNDIQQQLKTEDDIVLKYSELKKRIYILFTEYHKRQIAVQQFLQYQKDHHYLKEFLQKFDKAKNTLTTLQDSAQLIDPLIKQFAGEGQFVIEKPTESDIKAIKTTAFEKDVSNSVGKQEYAIKIFCLKHKKKIFFMSVVAFICVLIFFLLKFKPDYSSTSQIDCPKCREYLDNGFEFLQKGKFEQAIAEYKKAQDQGIDVTANIREVNNRAIDTLKTRAEREFNSISRMKIESYKATIKELEKARKFGTEKDMELIKIDYGKKTINYYIDEINKPRQTQNKKLEYAGYIMQIDKNNPDAGKIKNTQSHTISPSANFDKLEVLKVSFSITKDDKPLTVDDLNNIIVGSELKAIVKPANLKGKWKFGNTITISNINEPIINIKAIGEIGRAHV